MSEWPVGETPDSTLGQARAVMWCCHDAAIGRCQMTPSPTDKDRARTLLSLMSSLSGSKPASGDKHGAGPMADGASYDGQSQICHHLAHLGS